MISFEQLYDWRMDRAKALAKSGEPGFMGLPEIWFEHPRWFCQNGHVSMRYLKSEQRRDDVCLACFKPVVLGPNITEEEFATEMIRINRAQNR